MSGSGKHGSRERRAPPPPPTVLSLRHAPVLLYRPARVAGMGGGGAERGWKTRGWVVGPTQVAAPPTWPHKHAQAAQPTCGARDGQVPVALPPVPEAGREPVAQRPDLRGGVCVWAARRRREGIEGRPGGTGGPTPAAAACLPDPAGALSPARCPPLLVAPGARTRTTVPSQAWSPARASTPSGTPSLGFTRPSTPTAVATTPGPAGQEGGGRGSTGRSSRVSERGRERSPAPHVRGLPARRRRRAPVACTA